MANTNSKSSRVAKGRDIKRSKFYRLRITGGYVLRVRRVDLVALFMEGVMPTPLLNAVDQVQGLRKKITDGRASDLANMTRDDVESLNEAVRRVAVLAVVEPKLTHSKREARDNADLLWVGGVSDIEDDPNPDEPPDLSMVDQMLVWKAIMGEGGIEILSDDDALEFRQDEPIAHVEPVSDVDRVRAEAVDVDVSAGTTEAPRTSTPLVREWLSRQ